MYTHIFHREDHASHIFGRCLEDHVVDAADASFLSRHWQLNFDQHWTLTMVISR
jgi:hypothetical protein